MLTKNKSLSQEGFKYKVNTNDCKVNIDVLENLRKDKDIIVTKPDKGKGIVILNKSDYILKTKDILDDSSKFKKLEGDWFKIILKLEDKLNRLLWVIKKQTA